ncbi:GDP-mannose 4,6-dehydratase [Aromatoleum diolicum]|uniref:GDP-mannose 4,6-dehydratase n=1 Tax=Aromatoleum diolicum TaxID=75796 RepID=A0ABX1QFP6_9RHOO|nr:GDP-mannose 4,6-dehydratase [Aromatoleum diolicum]NMG77269.1 NAD-dependent epimerase/dehydratase family protein [Aromatoleum diolicum]
MAVRTPSAETKDSTGEALVRHHAYILTGPAMTQRTSVAIISGAGGQDGSYLAEWLLAHDYHVVALVRHTPAHYERLNHLRGKFDIRQVNLRDSGATEEILRRIAADEFYNLAARASSATLFDEPAEMGMENGVMVAQLLETLRRTSPQTRFCQAGSSEMFGNTTVSPQDETTAFRPRNPYGAAKIFAHIAVQTYRQRHHMFACNAILYNHESPRRSPEMVTRKVAIAAARAYRNLPVALTLGDLEARRDWGYAGDYVRALWLMLQQPAADDYVIATGILHSVRELCEVAFEHVDLDYRPFLRLDPSLTRAPESIPLVGNSDKARALLGWEPEVTFSEMIRNMVDAEVAAIDRNAGE